MSYYIHRPVVHPFSLLLTMMTVALASAVAAPGKDMPMPDFTQGDAIPEGATHDWTLGATGARGWIYSHKLETSQARQIAITKVSKDSPADGVLEVGDVILGVEGKPFSMDARKALGQALTRAESTEGGGRLSLLRWREGQSSDVVIKLPVLGSYSATAPYDCPKSSRILKEGCEALAERIADPGYKPNPISRSLNALALLASGERKYQKVVKEEAQWGADYSADSFQTWYYGYVIMLLSEYIMATGDKSVLPGLERLALEAAHGQSAVGSWGHRFAGDDGRLLGYGMMNAPGLPLTISLITAREAGVKDPAIDTAIERSAKLLRFYIGKGAVPYGDHHPWIQTHEDNGKCGMAAVLFHLLDEPEGSKYFSRMSVASHGSERDTGHTGNFWNIGWAMPGVALSGPHATGAWMKEFGAWYYDLARGHDGTFLHQGPPQPNPDSTGGWDATGAYLLAYAMPLRKIHLTGKSPAKIPQIDPAAAQALIDDGRGWSNNDRTSYYDALDEKELLHRLGSWSPIVRERAAEALARRRADVLGKLKKMLDSSRPEERLGACQALEKMRGAAAPAVRDLIKTLDADDLWLRVKAADALAAIGPDAIKAAPLLLEKLAVGPTPEDPRGMEQRYLSFALFNQRGGLLVNSLEEVDRDLLFKAVRAGLQNQDGRARGSFTSVYNHLSYEELQPLLPAIHEAIVVPSPSGIMFADQIQMAGLRLFAKNRVAEGMTLLADYTWKQKAHGSQKRIIEILDLLKSYGAHAQSVIPQLEVAIDYFENKEEKFPRNLSLGKAQDTRDAIAAIRASKEKPELIQLRGCLKSGGK